MKLRTKVLLTLVIGLIITAIPIAAQARAQILDFVVDRTTVNEGQQVTFDIQTNNMANFVFAMVDGVRFAATRISEENEIRTWELVITPQRSANVSVFANTSNNENGAVRVRMPIQVISGPQTPGGTPPVTLPSDIIPDNIPPLGIHSIRETPARAQGEVQLTVVTGTAVEEVWTRLAEGRYVRGERASRERNYQTFVINFTPLVQTPHTLQVWANRVYEWRGATMMSTEVNLIAPFVPNTTPLITNVTMTPTTPTSGQNVTVRIRTNQHVENVWVRDVNGVEREARRIAPTTTMQRNFEVIITPFVSGNIQIYANVSRNTEGAATQTETVNVTTGAVMITNATATHPIANAQGVFSTTVRVTTNPHARAVWAVAADGQNRVQLTRISGTNETNQVWEGTINTSAPGLTVRASATTTSTSADTTMSIVGWSGTGDADIHNVQIIRQGQHVSNLVAGQSVTVRVTTTTNTNRVTITDNRVHTAQQNATLNQALSNATHNVWDFTFTAPNTPNVSVRFDIRAFIQGQTVDSAHQQREFIIVAQ